MKSDFTRKVYAKLTIVDISGSLLPTSLQGEFFLEHTNRQTDKVIDSLILELKIAFMITTAIITVVFDFSIHRRNAEETALE